MLVNHEARQHVREMYVDENEFDIDTDHRMLVLKYKWGGKEVMQEVIAKTESVFLVGWRLFRSRTLKQPSKLPEVLSRRHCTAVQLVRALKRTPDEKSGYRQSAVRLHPRQHQRRQLQGQIQLRQLGKSSVAIARRSLMVSKATAASSFQTIRVDFTPRLRDNKAGKGAKICAHPFMDL
ncbi:hypothetical protein FHG87_019753 [Trinorchestia longiramus]|nr:hypothetical protein FHG87_019753 [Trinorchestia longiramus]